jgi:hypothetical protein
MPVVDARGRVFGTINLIDLGLLLCAALLVPLLYGAYVLFHTPPPRLIAVMPDAVSYGRGVEQHVQVSGEHLRPFLRAKVGGFDASAYSLQTPEAAEIRFVDVPPGIHDIVLFDESQEVARLSGALSVLPPPVRALGWFVDPPAGGKLVPGLKWGAAERPTAELLEVAPAPEGGKLRGTVRVICRWSAADRLCMADGWPVSIGGELHLTSGSDRLTFFVNELRTDATWLHVKVRFIGLPDALDRIRVSDTDAVLDGAAAFAEMPIPGVTAGAIVLSLGERLKNQGTYGITASRPQPGSPLSAFNVLSAIVPVDAQLAELTIPVPTNLVYRGVAIRPGNVFVFETKDYRVEALVLSASAS